ncbi:hypothetical protein [Aurantimonas sp. 22II-16-19i]|uniref:hypothetical protein n=1 Tax=Aurantimonas sp. 22II-16-19i TaxID=1317114 RepID=UPI0009F7A69F|nr:hypothetical protein [Aurantimonas sp. 22II-16-19i]ORE93224.1 hypothetical protein ATO4_15775 [Aurantimonas sp. 22II-16-19i]
MSDPFDSDLSVDDAFNIAGKIVEMAERVRKLDVAVPGARAKWFFEVDDDRFEVNVAFAGKAKGEDA